MSADPSDVTDGTPPLQLTQDERDGHTVFVLEGDIDLESSRTLRADLLAALPSGDEKVVVDLARVGCMDSSGLAALVSAWKVVRERGSFRVAGANEVVHRVLTITGMEEVFDLHTDVDAALRAPRA